MRGSVQERASRSSRAARAWPAAISTPWLALWGALASLVVVSVGLGRFPEWDEAVFFSQSGGVDGLEAPPASMAASREIGPAILIALLRAVPPSFAGVRMLWALVTITVLVLGFRELSKTIGGAPAMAGAAIFGTSWVVLLYSASFYGSLLASCLALAGVGVYLRLRERALDHSIWWYGMGLGALMAGALWLRHIETVLVLVGVFLHSVVVRPRCIWSHRRMAVAGAAMSLVVAFAVPWIIDSISRYGSVGARLEAARSQEWPTGLINRAPDYLKSLLGESITYKPLEAATPMLSVGRVMQALTIAVFIGAAAMAMRPFDRIADPGTDRTDVAVFLALLSAISFGFFFFYASNTQDRYLMFGWIYACALLGWAGVRSIHALSRSIPRGGALLMGGLLILWVCSQLLILRPYELARTADSQATDAVAQTVRTVAGGQPCSGVARYGAPQLQLGSGCTFQSISSAEDAAAALRRFDGATEPRFVVIPRSQAGELATPQGWTVAERIRTTGAPVLVYSYMPGH